jgi:predicted ATPase
MIKLLKVVSEFGMGGNSVVMIKGKSGTGKSELLSRFAKFAAFEGFIMEGRFSKDDKTPYSAIRAGLRTQFQCALKAWTNEERLAVTNKLLYTFDETGLDIICNMVPEMAVLVGRDGEFQRADISADKFNTTLTKLFRRMSSQDHPLIIMLDDLQWADQASLGLLAKLSQDLDKDTDTRLLIVGAYRDSDVDERHPLQTVLLNKLSIDTLTQITVKPLDQAEVTELIQDSFPSFEPRKVESLASAIYERTLGVPFMVNQFLQSLSSDSALVTRQGSTVHDELIQNIKQTDNILVSNLNALKSDLYSILTLGSYFSTEFNTTIMSNVLKTLQLSVAVRFFNNFRFAADYY